jgi:hypothetical protein
MAITLSRSEFLTETTVAPKPVPSKQTFASYIAGKVVKGLLWVDKDESSITIMFTDFSQVIISGDAHGPHLRFVSGPPDNKPVGYGSYWKKTW